ncbi:hypothetical protein [Albimonas pacifica]|uniref:VPLPA-CTERM protein sorting domain-containing protein n=1 Tax=Albimonas pacifica TaxID=1114924 RepID=A0A1I3MY78_9RHOB|nr:hypothetical protein [Albimonas pacifica]SFJ01948.1 hypothetical protein SAMN05216258_11244 [Albimonas pacifica]
MKIFLAAAALAATVGLCAAGAAQATPVAIYDFESGTPLVDQTGNFGTMQLHGTASLEATGLRVRGAGTTPQGYASADYVVGSATFESMTLISWVTLLDYSARAGSALTLDTVSTDRFNGIVFGESVLQEWTVGSNNFRRLGDSVNWDATQPLNQKVQMAYTFEKTDGGAKTRVTGYRDGALLGTYEVATFEQFDVTDGVIWLGARHQAGATMVGALNAIIHRVEIHDNPLSSSEVEDNFETVGAAVPAPAALPLAAMGLGALAAVARRRRQA